MYIKTVNDKEITPSKRKVRLVINKIKRNGTDAYFAEAKYREMAFFIAITPKYTSQLCG